MNKKPIEQDEALRIRLRKIMDTHTTEQGVNALMEIIEGIRSQPTKDVDGEIEAITQRAFIALSGWQAGEPVDWHEAKLKCRAELKQLIHDHTRRSNLEAQKNEVYQYLNRSDSLGEEKYATRRLKELDDVS